MSNIKVNLRLSFSLVIANILILVYIFFFASVSTLVMVATLPAVIYAIYTKRAFLIIFSIGIYAILIAIFFLAVLNPLLLFEMGERLNLIIWLYTQIYPYQVNVDIFSLLGVQVLFWVSIFIFLTLFIGSVFKMNEFKIMIAFSFLIIVFNSCYLVLNVFIYIFPQLEVLILGNVVSQFVFLLFYVLLPFITLNYMFLYLELIALDERKRREYKLTAQDLNKGKDKPKIFNMMTFMLIIIVLIIVFMIAM